MTDKKPTGRLLGGLLHVRHALTSERGKDIGWAVAQAAIGGVIGLILATAYLAYR